jgi:hypothetical protein
MNFSRNTIIETCALFDGWTTNEFQRFLLRFALEQKAPASLGSKPTRINALATHLLENPSLVGPGGANIILEIIEFILGVPTDSSRLSKLANSLQLDGYTINNGILTSILPSSLSLASKQTEVESLLSKFAFSIAEGHLKQALNAHTRGDWAAANSQMRTFVESLFDSFAEELLSPPLPTTSHSKREQLAKLKPPFIDPLLNEWDFSQHGGCGLVQGFWKRLHPDGSHPGLSDEDDCTFRLQLVYLVAHRFLKRFENYS